MKVIDSGHKYALLTIDGERQQTLTFVKRHDPERSERFPGNTESYQGTILQSVLRACVDRVRYLNNQIPCAENPQIIERLEKCIYFLEIRAARRHGVRSPTIEEACSAPMCPKCGHVVCGH